MVNEDGISNDKDKVLSGATNPFKHAYLLVWMKITHPDWQNFSENLFE